MKNIKEVYDRLCLEYNDYQPIMDEENEFMILSNGSVRVDVNKESINLYVNLKSIAHCHISDFDDKYNEIYETIKYYINEHKMLVKKSKIKEVVTYIILVIIGVIIFLFL